MRGSVLGVGTDVGGSIRIPALCNGLYGVKPSHGRTPYVGQEGGMPEGSSKLGIEATAGPIAHSIRDCEMFLRVIGDNQPWLFDPEVLPQSWDHQLSVYKHPVAPGNRRKPALRIGIVRTDGNATPLPPIQKLIDEVAARLRSEPVFNLAPIQVIDVDISSLLSKCLKVSNGIFSIDGANAWFDLLEMTSEPLSPWLQNRLKRRPAKATDEVRKLQAQMLELDTRALGIWKQSGGFWTSLPSTGSGDEEQVLDILICPAAPHPVPPIDRWNSVNYTSAFNLLDLPAGILPVRAMTASDLHGEVPNTEPLNGWDKTNRELWGEKEKACYVGSMLSVQVVAPRLQERRLVEAMDVVDRILKGGAGGSGGSKL
jgi:amidase